MILIRRGVFVLSLLFLLIVSAWTKSYIEDLPTTFVTRTGSIGLISDAPLEIVKAESDKLYGVVNLVDKKLAFSVTVNSFEGFNSSLQREHFQEKFLESDRFPKATFSGKLICKEPFDHYGTYQVRAKGILDIHGVKKERIITGTLVLAKKQLTVHTTLRVPLHDHDITVPTIVNQKIAKEIDIHIHADMLPRSE